jgi:hypothetical protein
VRHVVRGAWCVVRSRTGRSSWFEARGGLDRCRFFGASASLQIFFGATASPANAWRQRTKKATPRTTASQRRAAHG